ncbi:MAG: hypothetical protein ACTHPS_05325 [Streptosporangiaceae bacterium]
MSAADLDALDRGVIEAGGLAAEALSRLATVEARVARIGQAARVAYGLGWEAGLQRGLGDDPTPALDGPRGGRRHLTPVPSIKPPGRGQPS